MWLSLIVPNTEPGCPSAWQLRSSGRAIEENVALLFLPWGSVPVRGGTAGPPYHRLLQFLQFEIVWFGISCSSDEQYEMLWPQKRPLSEQTDKDVCGQNVLLVFNAATWKLSIDQVHMFTAQLARASTALTICVTIDICQPCYFMH